MWGSSAIHANFEAGKSYILLLKHLKFTKSYQQLKNDLGIVTRKRMRASRHWVFSQLHSGATSWVNSACGVIFVGITEGWMLTSIFQPTRICGIHSALNAEGFLLVTAEGFLLVTFY